MADLKNDLIELLDYYKYDDYVPIFRLQALLDAEEQSARSDSYITGKPPSRFVAIPSQGEGGRCIE